MLRYTEEERWIRKLNRLLALDIMHGIQWYDLDDDEQRDLLAFFKNGRTPEEALRAYQEGPL